MTKTRPRPESGLPKTAPHTRVYRHWARALVRLMHPTVAPHPRDVDKFAYALRQFDREMVLRRKMSTPRPLAWQRRPRRAERPK